MHTTAEVGLCPFSSHGYYGDDNGAYQNSQVASASTLQITEKYWYWYTLLSQWEFFPWEIRVTFPKESQLQQSRATQT